METKDKYIILQLRNALNESLKLQSHYARLLNKYDNGERMSFYNIEDWIKRLKELGLY